MKPTPFLLLPPDDVDGPGIYQFTSGGPPEPLRAARIARPLPFGGRLPHRGLFSRFFGKRGY